VYRLRELGWLQFERLVALLVPGATWTGSADRGRLAELPRGVRLPGGTAIPGPVRAEVRWPGGGAGRGDVVFTPLPEEAVRGRVVVGARTLTRALDADPALRLALPSVLGLRDLAPLLDPGVVARSAFDPGAAAALARVFVPTHTHARTLEVLAGHAFAVLTGPPEMGKTAIARMVGLARLTAGWEVHECTSPDALWRAFAPDRPQVFVADDAFGSTEYRPDAAERWARALDGILRALDDRHWLLWTSRPTPLRAGLRRVHRERGAERFPAPGQVLVDAAALSRAEKALIVYRHARAAALPPDATALVRAAGLPIVRHPHFTPERIRRFVGGWLASAPLRSSPGDALGALVAELSRPTEAMAASFAALGPEHRALLVALLDVPPGPVDERRLAASLRRHAPAALPRSPHDLVDRLTDHFVRLEGTRITWVHPSWRDLVIDALAADGERRRAFLAAAETDGLLLALSVAGGARGERKLPLLREDRDWDALGDRLAAVCREVEEGDAARLLAGLAEAARAADAPALAELEPIGALVLRRLARRWDAERRALRVDVLESWFALSRELADRTPPPSLDATWVELMPDEDADAARLDDWLALAEVLDEFAPGALARFEFPERYDLDALLTRDHGALAGRLAERLARLGLLALAPALLARTLEPEPEPLAEADRPARAVPDPDDIVGRVLADLDRGA